MQRTPNQVHHSMQCSAVSITKFSRLGIKFVRVGQSERDEWISEEDQYLSWRWEEGL